MDNRTIFSKTGKGSLEISKKTIKLASDERQTLILVDGKSNLGEIEEKHEIKNQGRGEDRIAAQEIDL